MPLWKDPRYLSSSIMIHHIYVARGYRLLMNRSPHTVFIFLHNRMHWYKDGCERTCTWNSRWTHMLDLFFGHVIKSTIGQYKILHDREENSWWHRLLRYSPRMWWNSDLFNSTSLHETENHICKKLLYDSFIHRLSHKTHLLTQILILKMTTEMKICLVCSIHL